MKRWSEPPSNYSPLAICFPGAICCVFLISSPFPLSRLLIFPRAFRNRPPGSCLPISLAIQSSHPGLHILPPPAPASMQSFISAHLAAPFAVSFSPPRLCLVLSLLPLPHAPPCTISLSLLGCSVKVTLFMLPWQARSFSPLPFLPNMLYQ